MDPKPWEGRRTGMQGNPPPHITVDPLEKQNMNIINEVNNEIKANLSLFVIELNIYKNNHVHG